MKFSVFQLSRIGGRAVNEDRMGYCYTRESCLLVLADGMGGHPDGEVAAQLALEMVSTLYQREATPVVSDPVHFLSAALLAAHQRIVRHAIEKGMLDTPRTTLVAAVLQDGRATWVHCGDSRLYLARGGELLMRTRDHSYLEQEMAGNIRAEHANRNILYSCLGSPSKPIYDITGPITLAEGDKLMLCSDGLWGCLDDDTIVRNLVGKSVSDAVPELVDSALQAGGNNSDNVTVLAIDWETPDTFEATRTASIDSMLDGSFASTVQAGLYDSVNDELDEAEIERSIAEINEAIRRSAAKKA